MVQLPNIEKNLLITTGQIAVNRPVKIISNNLGKTGTKTIGRIVVKVIIKTKPDTTKIISPHVVDINLHTHQVGLINPESITIRLGHKIDNLMIGITITIIKKLDPMVKIGKRRAINGTMIDLNTGIAVVIVAIKPQTAIVKETVLGTVVVDNVLEFTS